MHKCISGITKKHCIIKRFFMYLIKKFKKEIDMSAANILKTIKDKEVEYVDLRFTDPRGKLQHLTQDISTVNEDLLTNGVFLMVHL